MNAASKKISELPPLRDVIRDAGLQATKALGQNFLLDLNLTGSIVKQVDDITGLDIVEIGPGPGGLTRAIFLNGNPHSVHAIEFDDRAIAALQPLVTASDARLHLHHEDALNADIMGFGTNGQRAIMANLPYNIASPLLIKFLKDGRAYGEDAWRFMVLMFQKEVADRIVAAPGSKIYGRLSVMAQWLCTTKIVKTLPPSAFTPPPKISSAVVLFKPRSITDAQPRFETMEKLVAMAFGQRRKMVRASLRAYVRYFDDAGITPTLRAEDMDVASYVRLALCVEGQKV